MGVDFDTCDTCGETTCDENIEYMSPPGLGDYKTCSICVRKYFSKEYEEDTQRSILECESGYLFIAAPKGTETKAIIVWQSTSPDELLSMIEEAGHDTDTCLYDCNFDGSGKFDPTDTYTYGEGDYDVCFRDAFDTCVSDYRKMGKDVTEGYSIQWVPKNTWKKLMYEQLDKKIGQLQDKRRKLG